jgi:SAM-dependent methyltransferase
MSGSVRTHVGIDDPAELGIEFWRRADLVDAYDRTDLRPVETVLLERYRAAMAGRVLELGVGAGRLTRYLCPLATELQGIDISRVMVHRAREVCPGATILVRDLREIDVYEQGSFDAVVAGFNVLDVLDHDDRQAVLDGIRRVLQPQGMLIFSSHNRGLAPAVLGPVAQVLQDLQQRRLRRVLIGLARLPRRIANHARLRRLERDETEYAVVNDVAHDYALAQYYIGRDDQERQLRRHGFRLVECLDLAGSAVLAGALALGSSELHYVATVGL